MSAFNKFREEWLRPALFFGNNPISLAGGAITTGSGITMISYWLAELSGHLSDNPYLGIIFFLFLPALFLLGLALIPIGVYLRRRTLQKAGQIPAVFPRIDLNDRIFRHGIDIVLVATIVNFLVVATASYHGAEYMDSPKFCGASCHVMTPEYTAYQISPHSHVACVECHIGTGAEAYVNAKINGTKQLLEVTFHPFAPLAPKIIPNYPTPIPSPVTSLRPARYTCEACHTPTRFDGDKLLVKSSFADDEQNTESQTVLILHLGGEDSLSHRTGIHGVHLGHIEYICHRSHAHHDSLGAAHQPRRHVSPLYAASALNGRSPRASAASWTASTATTARRILLSPRKKPSISAMADGAISSSTALHSQGGSGTAEWPLHQPG